MTVHFRTPLPAGVLQHLLEHPVPPGFLTVEQAAARLKLSPQRVRVLLAKRRLQGFLVRVGGRDVWAVHASLHRRPAKAGRPRTKRRKAAASDGGSEAKP